MITKKTFQSASKTAKKATKGTPPLFVEDAPKYKPICTAIYVYSSTNNQIAHVIPGTKADFNAITAERPAPSTRNTSVVLNTEGLAAYERPAIVSIKETYELASPPKSLAKSFAYAAGAVTASQLVVPESKRAISGSKAAAGPQRARSVSPASSSPSSPVSSTFSEATTRTSVSFASVVKGNGTHAIQGQPTKAIMMTVQGPRAMLQASSADNEGFEAVSNNKKVKQTTVSRPQQATEKPKVPTSVTPAVPPPKGMKLKFVKTTKDNFPALGASSREPPQKIATKPIPAPPSPEQLEGHQEKPVGWTVVSNKKGAKDAAPAESTIVALTPPIARKQRHEPRSTPIVAPEQAMAPTQDVAGGTSHRQIRDWVGVPYTKSSKVPKPYHLVHESKQSTNPFDKLDRVTKLPAPIPVGATRSRETQSTKAVAGTAAATAVIVTPKTAIKVEQNNSDAEKNTKEETEVLKNDQKKGSPPPKLPKVAVPSPPAKEPADQKQAKKAVDGSAQVAFEVKTLQTDSISDSGVTAQPDTAGDPADEAISDGSQGIPTYLDSRWYNTVRKLDVTAADQQPGPMLTKNQKRNRKMYHQRKKKTAAACEAKAADEAAEEKASRDAFLMQAAIAFLDNQTSKIFNVVGRSKDGEDGDCEDGGESDGDMKTYHSSFVPPPNLDIDFGVPAQGVSSTAASSMNPQDTALKFPSSTFNFAASTFSFEVVKVDTTAPSSTGSSSASQGADIRNPFTSATPTMSIFAGTGFGSMPSLPPQPSSEKKDATAASSTAAATSPESPNSPRSPTSSCDSSECGSTSENQDENFGDPSCSTDSLHGNFEQTEVTDLPKEAAEFRDNTSCCSGSTTVANTEVYEGEGDVASQTPSVEKIEGDVQWHETAPTTAEHDHAASLRHCAQVSAVFEPTSDIAGLDETTPADSSSFTNDHVSENETGHTEIVSDVHGSLNLDATLMEPSAEDGFDINEALDAANVPLLDKDDASAYLEFEVNMPSSSLAVVRDAADHDQAAALVTSQAHVTTPEPYQEVSEVPLEPAVLVVGSVADDADTLDTTVYEVHDLHHTSSDSESDLGRSTAEITDSPLSSSASNDDCETDSETDPAANVLPTFRAFSTPVNVGCRDAIKRDPVFNYMRNVNTRQPSSFYYGRPAPELLPSPPASVPETAYVREKLPVPEVADSHTTRPINARRHLNTQIGIITLSSFLLVLPNPSSTSLSKLDLITAYLAVAAIERDALAFGPCKTYGAATVLANKYLQHKVFVGHIKLAEFLGAIEFGVGGEVEDAKVVGAWEKCAEKNEVVEEMESRFCGM
ncbi:hypothetical protein EK21DRAFT_92103 [Setomelanomma holmii]|uniref:Uncharacterized protein n=1 Tax=Setomelanomma holmii TaxID=210430 RepID=A0A9P4LHF6_9PLEO|nr:hypothetical protein EK21DRAFT_92103 [Setomelanomma holmii]